MHNLHVAIALAISFPSTVFGCNYNVDPYVTTPPNFIPIISSNVCAMPRGLNPTDSRDTSGCDDVCPLASQCCENWDQYSGTAQLQNYRTVQCSTVNCGNVCRMACDRQGTDEECQSTCGGLTTNGTMYIFSRNGTCIQADGVIDAMNPTHVGFGFEVAKDLFVFGSVEDGVGCPFINLGFNNGFWMTTGTTSQMLATFNNPPASRFPGTLYGNVKPYDQYKTITVKKPNICNAVKWAEYYYSLGYAVAWDNCLNAVYTIAGAYGTEFPFWLTPQAFWCPSGTGPLSFFAVLSEAGWSSAQDIHVPESASPVTAATCPTTIPSVCQ